MSPKLKLLTRRMALAIHGADREDVILALTAMLSSCCERWGVPLERAIATLREAHAIEERPRG